MNERKNCEDTNVRTHERTFEPMNVRSEELTN